jgi:hypothetical protein
LEPRRKHQPATKEKLAIANLTINSTVSALTTAATHIVFTFRNLEARACIRTLAEAARLPLRVDSP